MPNAIIITHGEYCLAREALADVAAGQSSAARAIAAAWLGGRNHWRAILELWHDASAQLGTDRIACICIHPDGQADADVIEDE